MPPLWAVRRVCVCVVFCPSGVRDNPWLSTPEPGRFTSLWGTLSPCLILGLTSTDGGKVPHVAEQFADDRTGPGVQPVAADSQVELEPAGLESELHWGVQGSEVQLLSVYLVSSERAGELVLFK